MVMLNNVLNKSVIIIFNIPNFYNFNICHNKFNSKFYIFDIFCETIKNIFLYKYFIRKVTIVIITYCRNI